MSKSLYYLTQMPKSGIWYVRLIDPKTRKILTAKSSRTTNRAEAEKLALKWLSSGRVQKKHKSLDEINLEVRAVAVELAMLNLTQKDAMDIIEVLRKKGLVKDVVLCNTDASLDLIEFLTTFWTWEKSPYIQEKKMYEHSIHKYYVKRNLGMIENHWAHFFQGRTIGSITKDDIRKFQLHLSEKNLSAETFNQTVRAGLIALKWAHQHEMITNDCFSGITFRAVHHKKREVLTMEQASAIFHIPWKSSYSRLANLTAFCTGMRAGEIQALRLQDIGVDRLYVRHNWERGENKLKCCKNGEEREVPIPPELRDALLAQAATNPYNEGLQGFVFYGLIPKQPMDAKPWLTALRHALADIGYDDPKKICFHAWRHLYSARMADFIDQRKLQRATGHKTAAMLEHYANHAKEEDFYDLKQVSDGLFRPALLN